jgi:molecular chaperone DnaK
VAKGAALFAAHRVAELDDLDPDSEQRGRPKLPGVTSLNIINVTSKGYGTSVVKDEYDKVGHIVRLIQPNDEIPASPHETFYTVHHNQTRVQIEVYESTTDVLSQMIDEHLKLVEGELVGLPSGRLPGQPVEVNYNLGDDGILRVTASANGQELRLEAKITGATPPDVMDSPLPSIAR